MRLPDQLGPVSGWRLWQPVAGELRSINDGVPWAPGVEAVARCNIEWSHDSPVPDCSCGLFAMRSPLPTPPLERLVSGSVALWGRVIEHEEGYRAARAYPQALTVLEDIHCGLPFRADAKTEASLRSYGVPVRVMPLAEIESEIVRSSRLKLPYDDSTDVDQAVRAARAMVDAGAGDAALLPVLEHVRRVDMRALKWLRREPADLVHFKADLVYATKVTGLRRQQRVVTLRASKLHEFVTRQSSYYPTQEVTLDTKTGEIVERFDGCDVIRDEAHASVCPGRGLVRTLRPGPALALETWILFLGWMWSATSWGMAEKILADRGHRIAA